MALGADNQAPVISIDLTGMACSDAVSCENTDTRADGQIQGNWGQNLATTADHSNAFADECEVLSNHGIDDASCIEPSASASDHHAKDVVVTTTYLMYVLATPKSDLNACDATAHSSGTCDRAAIDFDMRGEYIIMYDATDGFNSAETLTFALILTDSLAPKCSRSPGCVSTSLTDSYRSYPTSYSVTIELCESLGSLYWAPETSIATEDAYDGLLSMSNSKLTANLIDVDGTVISTGGAIPRTLYNGYGLNTATSWDYQINSQDFAQIFGVDGSNNEYTENGVVWLVDTVNPVIVVPNPMSHAECGISEHPVATYTDCYDDYLEAHAAGFASLKNTVRAASASSEGSAERFFCPSQTNTDIAITYDVEDLFGNSATQLVTAVSCTDSLHPVLVITQLNERPTSALSEFDMTSADSCANGRVHGRVEASVHPTNLSDGHVAHCAAFNHGDGYMTYYHTEFNTRVTYSNMLDESVIQHSAGFEAGYGLINNLTREGKGYSCMDQCSVTTVTAQWNDSCVGSTVGTAFDTATVGTYYLKYTCNDVAGYVVTACRTIINVDKTRPVLNVVRQSNNILGQYVVEASRGGQYIDPGASCSDNVDGDISCDVIVSGDVVDLEIQGTFLITYECEDSANNVAVFNYRTVVSLDQTCPYCELPEINVSIEASFPYVDPDVGCSDTMDGIMYADETCEASPGRSCRPVTHGFGPDVEAVGWYIVTWSATDSSGNGGECNSQSKTFTIEDNLEPIVSLSYNGVHLMRGGEMAELSTTAHSLLVSSAVASAVTGVALLGYAATRNSATQTSVPV